MKRFDTELKKYADKVKLKAAERRELRERVLAYMEYHPLPKADQKPIRTVRREHFTFIPLNTIYTRVATGVFAVLLIVGVPFAAERAVPGDMLYPIKTNINEGLRSQFANSPYEKVAFETELIERRIAEARLLAREGKLTNEVEAKIAETVTRHASAAQQGIEEIKESDAEGGAIAEISFGSTLDVQSAVFESGLSTTTATATSEIANAVRHAIATSDARKGTTSLSYERLSGRIEQETTRAYELFETVDGSVTDQERNDIERRLGDIDRKITKAQELNTDDENQAAVAELVKALSKVHKLIVFMTYIDVRENVPLETLVPVELTDEERTVLLNEALEGVERGVADIDARATDLEDPEIQEKIEQGRATVTELIATATSSLEAGELDAADTAIKEAHALTTDIQALLPEVNLKENDPEEVPGGGVEDEAGTSTGTSTNDGTERGTTTATSTSEGSATSSEIN